MNFKKLVEESIQCLDANSYQEIQLPEAYSHVQRKEKEGELNLKNRFFDVADLGQLRTVVIDSPKINIITIFFFPSPLRQLPVFAMEFVVLGKRPIVGVIDTICLLNDMSCQLLIKQTMDHVHTLSPDLKQADDPPLWFQECRSGNDFFIRPQNKKEFDELIQAFSLVWQDITELFNRAEKFNHAKASKHDKLIQAYKDHHRIYSPGHSLMNRSFGQEWTQMYLTDYLFR